MTVTAWRGLAENVAESARKGDPGDRDRAAASSGPMRPARATGADGLRAGRHRRRDLAAADHGQAGQGRAPGRRQRWRARAGLHQVRRAARPLRPERAALLRAGQGHGRTPVLTQTSSPGARLASPEAGYRHANQGGGRNRAGGAAGQLQSRQREGCNALRANFSETDAPNRPRQLPDGSRPIVWMIDGNRMGMPRQGWCRPGSLGSYRRLPREVVVTPINPEGRWGGGRPRARPPPTPRARSRPRSRPGCSGRR